MHSQLRIIPHVLVCAVPCMQDEAEEALAAEDAAWSQLYSGAACSTTTAEAKLTLDALHTYGFRVRASTKAGEALVSQPTICVEPCPWQHV
eukprot:COSAG01_NODE_4243_length_5211_cov_7.043232_3_plen_91_part_00